MPYKSVKDLPQDVRDALPEQAQNIFMTVCNKQLDESPKDEAKALQIAWAAVKNAGFEKDRETGKWEKVAKSAPSEPDGILPPGDIRFAKEDTSTLADAVAEARVQKARWLLWESAEIPDGVALYDVQKADPSHKPLAGSFVPAWIPEDPQVVFATFAPGPIDAALRKMIAGPDGALFVERYLEPIGLRKEDVAIVSAVPLFLTGVDGAQRAPTPEEVRDWSPAFAKQLAELHGLPVVTLGKDAAEILGSLDCVVARLPHPGAIRKHGDSGEVPRKLERLKKILTTWQRSANLSKDGTLSDSQVWVSERFVELKKADSSKRLVGCVVIPVGARDAQGDVPTIEETEAALHDWMLGPRVIKDRHSGAPIKAAPVEAWVSKAPSHVWGNDPRPVNPGDACAVFKVFDDALWAKIQSGERNGVSIAGFGKRTKLIPRSI